MEFAFTPEQQRLREEIREFLRDALPGEYIPTHVGSQEHWDIQLAFTRRLAERNWVAPSWPVEYGALGWGYFEQLIFSEELALAGAPEGARVFNVGMIGPTLIQYGTEEQKAEHLPRITRGEVVWCQGYSEPGAGSDLANVQTRAVRDGDDYVLNGQKIWTTGAHNADWCFMLARTNSEAPRHRGLSFLLVDMRSPGITVNPIVNMAGLHEFNEIFFDDVRVPVRNRVGDEDAGWYVGMTLLDFERSNVASVARNQMLLERLFAHVREHGATPAVRRELAELQTTNAVARLMSYRIVWMQENGTTPSDEASAIKVLVTELGQRIANAGVQLLGLSGQLVPGSPHVPLDGAYPTEHLVAVSPTIYSGSSEIQRNIIATRGLGLPR